jgi:hypothetical protein
MSQKNPPLFTIRAIFGKDTTNPMMIQYFTYGDVFYKIMQGTEALPSFIISSE